MSKFINCSGILVNVDHIVKVEYEKRISKSWTGDEITYHGAFFVFLSDGTKCELDNFSSNKKDVFFSKYNTSMSLIISELS